jgi:hypothetical protein
LSVSNRPHQIKVQRPLTTHTASIVTNATRPLLSEETAPLFFDGEVELEHPLGAAAEGVNVAAALAKQEVAAAFAADTELGALLLTVPLPLKLQACDDRLFAS